MENRTQDNEREIDTLIAWSQRAAGDLPQSSRYLPNLTEEESAAFEAAELTFLSRLNDGMLEGTDEFSGEPSGDTIDDDDPQVAEAMDLEAVGLNRSTEHDDVTTSILSRRREELLSKHKPKPAPDADSANAIQIHDIEKIAADVLKSLDMWKLPVKPGLVATEENIQLCADQYGDGFDARIEYYKVADQFAIFHQTPRSGHTIGRVNFSVAHELGHYYLHSQYLLSGKAHDSQSDFSSRNPMERQADEFAAALLMPVELFRAEVKSLRREICTLKDIRVLADRRFGTSITSTARRYLKCDFEACAIVLSRDANVVWAEYSTDMQLLNMKFIQFGSQVPKASKTWKLLSEGGGRDIEGEVDADVWFDRPERELLWEETMSLGRTGLTLTFLTLPDPEMEI